MNGTFNKSPFDDASGKQLLAWLSNHGVGVVAPGGSGDVTLNGATAVAEANTNVTANSSITFTLKTVGGTVGAYPSVKTITPGEGFTVAGTAGDTSVYNYQIVG